MQPRLDIPPLIHDALARGAALAISISGGKDSQAMLRLLATHPDRPHWTGDLFAIHADLGRAEWPQTPGHVEAICKKEGIELVVVRRDKGDLGAAHRRTPGHRLSAV